MGLAPAVVIERIQQQAVNLKRSLIDRLKVLAKTVPSFVDFVQKDIKLKEI